MEKFLFRQRVLLMCSLNVEAAKGLNDMVKESSMKVGINLELMEKVLKEPSTIQIGAPVEYQILRALDPIAQAQLEVEEE